MRVRLYHVTGIPAGTHTVVKETKTTITVVLNGKSVSFYKKSKKPCFKGPLTLTYREA